LHATPLLAATFARPSASARHLTPSLAALVR